ncbi:alanyl-tRNA editing protein [Pseudomonas aeruginosa]|uniref:alanyl-tRNA editing protein n=1 Tax=Pseudomonas aeruginosa TaxID=287 RepID=UPI002270625A|nr:alanyl-tRNA editing protein [Pseudomonas aeruginosa]MCY0320529.1 alanyl-tRNA editing protein [Pseudomonas aeruginosa]MCY0326578.1 alanyl-tRNA editing protein [Pseudomonas aeruginosa]MCY0394409.1 alanyl-tRNA editing protein [Pseudomonas aeruginosa]MCY0436562.1 alanyl-tRNA editing protein [Pseudomonas aeruginosa]
MTQTASLFLQDSYREECLARITDVVEDGLLLDQTVFYPQGGGQAGDSGWLTLADGTRLRIADTRKGTEAGAGRDAILHIPAEGQATVLRAMKPGEVVLAQIDWVRRYRHMRLHTAAHMLCAVLPYPVNGCSITDEHARLDFVTSEPLSREAIDSALAAMVEAAHPVSIDTMSDDALRARPDLVRTMSVQPPLGAGQVRLVSIKDTDLQPCGGTHVANTEEVGVVRVSKMEKKSARTRRVVLVLG